MRQNPENKRAVQEGLHDQEDAKIHNLDRTDSRYMNEIETIAFLREEGFEVMKEFEPDKPLFYVYPGYLEKRLTKGGRWPSLALVEHPVALSTRSGEDVNNQEINHELWSAGNITEYAIDRETKAIERVSSRVKFRSYAVRLDYLFYAKDADFPKLPKTL